MSYKIIADSCCDLPEEMKKNPHIQLVPLTLYIEDKEIVDDETFDQKEFIRLVKESPTCPKSACPSPGSYMESYKGDEERVYVVTLSKELSGSYNSAVVGKDMYIEEYGEDKHIEVVNSQSACVGETQVVIKIMELEEKGLPFEEIKKEIKDFTDHLTTLFVLETLDMLKKNGRLTGVAALIATTFNIKPLMSATHGTIVKLDQARGIQRGLKKMIDYTVKHANHPENRILGITHCNCEERALAVRDAILAKANFKDCIVVDAAGVSSLYAADGGVVVTF
ncbi:hypothetical protein P261_02311 [Lachnospiraceae bacterium TWA4]|nr:hypothetical protein P261_02311 [Lachnospiraceae bacterium TWA4]